MCVMLLCTVVSKNLLQLKASTGVIFLTALELFSCLSQFILCFGTFTFLVALLHFAMSWFMEEYPTKAQGSYKLP